LPACLGIPLHYILLLGSLRPSEKIGVGRTSLLLPPGAENPSYAIGKYVGSAIGNESVPTQLAQCWFPGMAISSAKI